MHSVLIRKNYKIGLPVLWFYGNTIDNEQGGPFLKKLLRGLQFSKDYHALKGNYNLPLGDNQKD